MAGNESKPWDQRLVERLQVGTDGAWQTWSAFRKVTYGLARLITAVVLTLLHRSTLWWALFSVGVALALVQAVDEISRKPVKPLAQPARIASRQQPLHSSAQKPIC